MYITFWKSLNLAAGYKVDHYPIIIFPVILAVCPLPPPPDTQHRWHQKAFKWSFEIHTVN